MKRKLPTETNGAKEDPVLAALLKQRAEKVAKLDAKINQRKQFQNKQTRRDRNRVFVLTGIALHTEADLHPEQRKDITALLDRAIVKETDRAFLKGQGWL